MRESERVQVDCRVGYVARGKNVRGFAQNSRLACPHRTRDNEQRFRNGSICCSIMPRFRAGAMVREGRNPGNFVAAVTSVPLGLTGTTFEQFSYTPGAEKADVKSMSAIGMFQQ